MLLHLHIIPGALVTILLAAWRRIQHTEESRAKRNLEKQNQNSDAACLDYDLPLDLLFSEKKTSLYCLFQFGLELLVLAAKGILTDTVCFVSGRGFGARGWWEKKQLVLLNVRQIRQTKFTPGAGFSAEPIWWCSGKRASRLNQEIRNESVSPINDQFPNGDLELAGSDLFSQPKQISGKSSGSFPHLVIITENSFVRV